MVTAHSVRLTGHELLAALVVPRSALGDSVDPGLATCWQSLVDRGLAGGTPASPLVSPLLAGVVEHVYGAGTRLALSIDDADGTRSLVFHFRDQSGAIHEIDDADVHQVSLASLERCFALLKALLLREGRDPAEQSALVRVWVTEQDARDLRVERSADGSLHARWPGIAEPVAVTDAQLSQLVFGMFRPVAAA